MAEDILKVPDNLPDELRHLIRTNQDGTKRMIDGWERIAREVLDSLNSGGRLPARPKRGKGH